MKHINSKILLLSALVLLAGCFSEDSGSSGSTGGTMDDPAEEVYQSELDQDLAGRDEDANGIRDDIDDLLIAEFSDFSSDEQRFVRVIAKGFQDILLSQSENGKEIGNLQVLAVDCLESNGRSGFDISTNLFRATINTTPRFNAYSTKMGSSGGRIESFDVPLDLQQRCSEI